jgi:hypothetical protein
MGANLVRRINLGTERWCPELVSRVDSNRRGVVNEIGFRLFRARVRNEGREIVAELSEKDVAVAVEKARLFVERLPRRSREPVTVPTKMEVAEGAVIAERIVEYTKSVGVGQSILVSPVLPGCGILQACSADLLVGKTLYEIKAGDRDFRLVDVRQLLVYCALNQQSKKYEVEDIGLLNPRVGVSFVLGSEALAQEASGRSMVELSSEIINFLSREQVSR